MKWWGTKTGLKISENIASIQMSDDSRVFHCTVHWIVNGKSCPFHSLSAILAIKWLDLILSKENT